MLDGIDVYTESSAGYHIHAVRSKYAAKTEENGSQASNNEGKGIQDGCSIRWMDGLEITPLRRR